MRIVLGSGPGPRSAAGTAAVLVAVLATVDLRAQEPATATPPPASTDDAGSPATVVLSADFTTHYFFRGILQEDRGIIAQPALEVGKPLLEGGTGLFESVTLTLGQWNSLHSGDTGSGAGGGDAWYESDTYAGLSATHGAFTFGLTYTAYASPNGRFATVQEVAGSVAFDDGAWWSGTFTGFHPSATVAFETNGQVDAGQHPGIYAEFGVSPTLKFALRPPRDAAADDTRPQLTLSAPITVGLSVRDYYELGGRDDTFGYLDVGLALGMPLPLPKRLGSWSMTLALDAFVLGDNTASVNHDDHFEVVGRLGLSWEL